MAKVLIGNFKGPKGDTGAQGEQGDKGEQGDRGSRWTEGTAITGSSTTPTVFSGTGITDALAEDLYLNTDTGNVYRCTTAGTANVAKWVYACNIKGIKGDTGAKGDKGDKGEQGDKGDTGAQGPKGDTPTVADDMTVAFTEADSRTNIASGENTATLFGKIKKFFADLTAPAFAQMITTKDDLLANKATGYVPDAKAVADAVTDVTSKLIAPDYKSAVAIQSNYTCMTNGYVIGTIQGAVNGWASIRSSKNANYFLALCTSSENPIAVCIPFASGDSVIFGSSGTYNLAFAPAK